MRKVRNILKTVLVLVFTFFPSVYGQVTNYALMLDGADRVNCGQIPEINSSDSYTVQFFVNPTEWISNSYIYRRGAGNQEFSARLSATSGTVVFKVANQEYAIAGVPLSQWTQLSFVASPSGVDVWKNGEKTTFFTTIRIPDSNEVFTIGENFKGHIDEFRLWNIGETSAGTESLSFRNTVTKFHPKWNNLVLYYRFDQKLCAGNIVDYKNKHHGSMSHPIQRDPVTDNGFLKYKVVSGYSSFFRHSDRLQINGETHLMTNDLIMLDASVNGYTGEIRMSFPDNEGVISGGATYQNTFDQRLGVISFDGSGTMNVGKEIFRTGLTASENGSALVEGWYNITTWNEGATILQKKENGNKYVRIYLGAYANRELVVEVNGWKASFLNVLKDINTWQHIAVIIEPNASRVNRRIRVTINNIETNLVTPTGGVTNGYSITDINAETLIGENYIGKMDELMIWRNLRSNLAGDMNGTSPHLKFPGGGFDAIFLDAYWKFDDPSQIGKNTRGWKNLLSELRGKYKNHSGYKIRFGLLSLESDNTKNKIWPTKISDPAWRARLVAGVEKLLPYCDGIDLDLEWLYSGDPRWEAFGSLIQELRNVIPSDKVFSVSLHPIAYWVPKDKIPLIDYVTFQNYGPSRSPFQIENFKASYANFKNWGFSDEQIHLSVPTIVTDGSLVKGYKDIVEAMIPFDPSLNLVSGYTFNGVNQVKEKMNFLVDKNAGGTMYFDMGNDVSVLDDRSLIRSLNNVISANVDTLVTAVDSSISGIDNTTNGARSLSVHLQQENGRIIVENTNGTAVTLEIWSMTGVKQWERKIENTHETIYVSSLPKGIYILKEKTEKGEYTHKIIL